jgi:AcrR family transcriptional regulator
LVKDISKANVRSRQKRSLLTEKRLNRAAIEVLNESGLAGCTVPAIAKRAGVAVGTIYRRYADKEALLARAILDFVSLGGGEREADYAALAAEAADLRDFLRRVSETAVRTARENRTFLLAIRSFARTATSPRWRAEFEAERGRGRESILRAAMARFEAEIAGGEQALRLSLAALYGAVEVVWLEPQAGVFSEPPSPETFIEALAEMQAAFLTRGSASLGSSPGR